MVSSHARAESGSRRGVWLAALLLVGLVALAYWPAFSAGFVWDDPIYITDNPTLRSWSGLREIWFRPGATREYYPLVFTSFWVEYQLFGPEPFVYHLTNVVIHAAGALVLWLLLVRLAVPAAWMAAAVFAVHPVHVESVAWAIERKNLLSGLFALLALVAWERHLRSRTRAPLSWALAAFGAALLCKPAVAPLPAVMLLIAWWRGLGPPRATVRAAAPFVALAALSAALHIALEQENIASTLNRDETQLLERILVAGRALWFYAEKLAWPHPLMTHYPRWDVMLTPWSHALVLAAALAVPVVLWALRERIGRGPFTAVAAFGLMLAPALGLLSFAYLRFSFVADHLQYVPSIALTTLAVAGLGPRLPRAIRAPAAGLLLVVLTVLANRQAEHYQDQVTLFTHNVRVNPGAWGAHDQLCAEALKRRDYEAAARHGTESLRIKPDNDLALANLVVAQLALEKHADARATLEVALARRPDDPGLRVNLAMVHENLGDTAGAAREYERALALDPRRITALNNLALLRESDGRLGEARDLLRTALEIQPDLRALRENLERIERALEAR